MTAYPDLKIKPKKNRGGDKQSFPMFRVKNDRIELVMVIHKASRYIEFIQEIYLPGGGVHKSIKTAPLSDDRQSWHQTFDDAKEFLFSQHSRKVREVREQLKQMNAFTAKIKRMRIDNIGMPRDFKCQT